MFIDEMVDTLVKAPDDVPFSSNRRHHDHHFPPGGDVVFGEPREVTLAVALPSQSVSLQRAK